MAYVAAAVAVIGAVAGAVSGVMGSDANAKGLDAEARSVKAQAEFDERQYRREASLVQGEAIATSAASGVDISSGSPLLHELDRVKQREIAALNIRRGGENQVAALKYQSRMTRRQIPFQIIGGGAQVGSILSSYAGRGGFQSSRSSRGGVNSSSSGYVDRSADYSRRQFY